MYNNRSSFTRNPNQGPSNRFQRRPYGRPGGRPFGRPGGGGGRTFNRFNSRKSTVHESHFVKKAIEQPIVAEYVPKTQFATLPINETLKRNILQKGYTKPTPIQDGAIQPVLDGRDVIGIANTGTGKTAAFLIPLIDKAIKTKERTLIIIPTRELATQIRDEFRAFANMLQVYAVLCIGGSYIRQQIFELKRQPHFVIGTPGRLKDLMKQRALDLSQFKIFVLDEVDRMVDMGFIDDIKFIISHLPKVRQSLFFSATVSKDINTLIQQLLINPVTISVKSQETAANIDQDIVRIPHGTPKLNVLTGLLKKEEFKKVLIFGRTKHGVERLSRDLYAQGFKVSSIHGDKPQAQRNRAIRFFKEDVINILVATDVAARGLDIHDVTHVINFDAPATYEDYVHRIGRTGRANKKGQALTFVD